MFAEMQFPVLRNIQATSTVICIPSWASVTTETGEVWHELSQLKLCTCSRAWSFCSQPSGVGILSCFDKSGLCATLECWSKFPLWCGLLIILLVFSSSFNTYWKIPDVHGIVWPSSCGCKTSTWSCQIKDLTLSSVRSLYLHIAQVPLSLKTCHGKPVKVFLVFFLFLALKPSGFAQRRSVSSARQGLMLATFPICC